MERYFYDFEFEEDGDTIIPISLGMVSEDGRELYLINKSYMQSYIDLEGYHWKGKHASVITSWLSQNVCDKISQEDVDKYGEEWEDWGPIVLDFISKSGQITRRSYVELWGYYVSYDHVALAQIYGPMINLPEPIPMYSKELKQIIPSRDRINFTPDNEHNALSDAHWNRKVWELYKDAS